MGIVKLTENLESFKWTDYSKIGNNSDIDPNKGGIHGSTRDETLPHQESHLEKMVSEFGPLDTSSNRGPYKEVDYVSGRIGEWGGGTLPLGFTKDMESSLLGPDKQMILTPLSYTIAGMNSSLEHGIVPEQTLNITPIALGAHGSDFSTTPVVSYVSAMSTDTIFDSGFNRENMYIGGTHPASDDSKEFPFEVSLDKYDIMDIPSDLEHLFLYNHGKTGLEWPYRVLSFTGDHPLVRKDVGDRYEFGDGIDNWMALQVVRTGNDIERIEKWLETTDGQHWQEKQHMLQNLNPREETRIWGKSNLILSIPPLFHATRHFGGETYMDKADFGPLFSAEEPSGITLGSILGAKFPKLAGNLKIASGKYDSFMKKFDKLNSFLGDVDFNDQGAGGRLKFLRDRFILGDTEKDSTINLGGLGDISLTALRNKSAPFGRTPKVPTQTTFSQRGAFGRGDAHKEVPGKEKGSILQSYKGVAYGDIGKVRYNGPASPYYSDAELEEPDWIDVRPNALPDLSSPDALTKKVGSNFGNTGFARNFSAIAQFDAMTDKYKVDKKNKEETDALIDAWPNERAKSMNDLGDPTNTITRAIGDTSKGDRGGADLGLIKTDGGSKKYRSMATDKINILPYGHNYKTIDGHPGPPTGEVSDFIKFKFKDIHNNKFLIFRALLSGISDGITPEWTGTKYIGRPDQVYVYSGAERKVSFNFDIYPKTKQEFPVLLEKLNYLIGLCYPSFTRDNRMIAPFIELTIGDMFHNTPGFLDSLSVSVEDNSTWEIEDGLQFPKYIKCDCSFTYVGKYMPSTLGKHYELGWLDDKGWSVDDTGTGTKGTFTSDKNVDTLIRQPSDTHDMTKLFSSLDPLPITPEGT